MLDRFKTLETLEGSTYLIIGFSIFAGLILGLIEFLVTILPFVAIIMIGVGSYKTFIKRDKNASKKK